MISKPVVVLDPGHGGYDPGAVACGLKEKDLNLTLALKVAEKLEGIKVLLTRERDVYVSLADRVALSRRAEPDLFLSLHANAGGGRGFESFIYSGLGAKDPAIELQKALHREVMGTLNRWEITDRGLKQAAFYVLRQNPNPAVLLESLFIDNAREAEIWREPLFIETLAAGIGRGVKAGLGFSTPDYKANVVDPGKEDKTGGRAAAAVSNQEDGGQGDRLYIVQVGAFSFVENARQLLAEVQKAGFNDAFITQKLPSN